MSMCCVCFPHLSPDSEKMGHFRLKDKQTSLWINNAIKCENTLDQFEFEYNSRKFNKIDVMDRTNT